MTYLELLQLVKEGKQPKKILVCGREYEWNEYYASYTREKIGLEIKYLTEQKCIFLVDDFVCHEAEYDLATENYIEVK